MAEIDSPDTTIKKKRGEGDEVEEYSGPKFLGCFSIKTGFVIFGLSDLMVVIIGSVLVKDGVLRNVFAQIVFFLLFVPQVLMFFVILISDNIMTRTIGYYLLLIKIVA